MPASPCGLCTTTTGSSCSRRLFDRNEATGSTCREDLGRLERILVLRYLGLRLHEIAALLDSASVRGPESLAATLARQSAVLRERRDGLDRVLRTVESAQQRMEGDAQEPEWFFYQAILKELQRQGSEDWTERYWSPDAVKALRERRAALSPEQGSEMKARWQAMYAEVRSAADRGVLPDSAEGRALVARWMRLADEFSNGDAAIGEGFRRMFEDESHWPDDERAARLRAAGPAPEVRAFFH